MAGFLSPQDLLTAENQEMLGSLVERKKRGRDG